MTLADRSVRTLLETMASGTVPPAGGSLAAITGAAAAACCELVCAHAPADPKLAESRTELADRRERLLALADDDAAAVEGLLTAGENGDDGSGEGAQPAIERATEVPLATAAACLDVLERARAVAATTDRSVGADAIIGGLLAHGALRAAVFTANANLATIEDETVGRAHAAQLSELERAGDAAVDRLTSLASE